MKSMKVLHLGDLHLGKSVNDFNMIDDQRYILEQVLAMIQDQGIDALLLAGDIYDRSVPSEEAVHLLDHFLCRLSEICVDTFIISGNHDSEERLHFGSRLFKTNHVYISAKYDGTIYKKECLDEFGKINIYLLPFVKASQVKYFYPEEKIESYEDAVRVTLAHTDIDTSERNILVAHQFVAGKSADPKVGGSEGAAVLNVGTIEKIGADCFDDFDYVALGHIHSPQKIGRETLRYSGSILKYSQSEVSNSKSAPVVTFGKKGEVSVELAELRPRRDMRHVKGKMEQLLDPKHIVSPEDYIYVTLTDEEPIPDAISIFQQHYKNTMKIMYDNAYTREKEQVVVTKAAEKDFSERISDFYHMMYGCDISEDELKIMKEIAEEAGVDI